MRPMGGRAGVPLNRLCARRKVWLIVGAFVLVWIYTLLHLGGVSFSSWNKELYMTFETCGQLSNQRLSIMYGLVMAHALDATVVIPALSSEFRGEDLRDWTFDQLYDRQLLREGLKSTSLRIVDALPEELAATALSGSKVAVERALHEYDWLEKSKWRWRFSGLVQFDCAYFAVNLAKAPRPAVELAWQVDRALQLSADLAEDVQTIFTHLQATGPYTALHARVDEEWREFCSEWRYGDNCYTGTSDLTSFLKRNKVANGSPVYLATSLTKNQLTGATAKNFIELLPVTRNYHVVLKDDAAPGVMTKYNGNKQILGAIDYEVCRLADTFVGNSVSTFSALILLASETAGRENAYWYNGGEIPLKELLPSVPFNGREN